MFNVDGFAKSHQRAPGGAPESRTDIARHGFVRKAEMTLFAFRGAKSPAWTFYDSVKAQRPISRFQHFRLLITDHDLSRRSGIRSFPLKVQH